MIVTRDMIVAEAMSWVGTPVRDQMSKKGVGVDCKGMIAGIARELGMASADSVYARMHNYRSIDPALLIEGLEFCFEHGDLACIEPADVLLLNMHVPPEPRPGKPRHLAIVGYGKLIHAYGRAHNVVSATDLAPSLRLWKPDSLWRWPGVA
jgi:cell wall-associated NlpC family hydrolase